MLSKKYRLQRSQINLIYKKGRSKNFDNLGVKVLANNGSFNRFAVVVPRAVEPKVVLRNRFRRIIYDEISKIKNLQKQKPNYDYIIRLYKTNADEKALRKKIGEILKSV